MPLPEYCGYTPLQRYFWTIGRKTHRVPDESGHIILQQYIDGLAAQHQDEILKLTRTHEDKCEGLKMMMRYLVKELLKVIG